MLEDYYLPHELVNYTNYPELLTYRQDIEDLLNYSLTVHNALQDYNEGIYDRIDVNMEEVQNHITLCRTLSDVLGKAPRVCFDVLLEIRVIQEHLHKLVFLKNTYGNQYVGTPSPTSEGGVL